MRDDHGRPHHLRHRQVQHHVLILVVGRIWVQPSGLVKAGWWVAMCGLSTGTYYAVERVTRRFLPLASLLKLTLIFPDEAPSRFSMALRSGNTKHFQKTIEDYKQGQIPLDIGQRARPLGRPAP